MARDPVSQRTADGVMVSPLCEVEAGAGVSPLGKARWECPVCGDSAQRPLHKKGHHSGHRQTHTHARSLSRATQHTVHRTSTCRTRDCTSLKFVLHLPDHSPCRRISARGGSGRTGEAQCVETPCNATLHNRGHHSGHQQTRTQSLVEELMR